MRILFLQKDVFGRPSIMLLSAILKRAGYRCNVLVDDLETNMIKKALKLDPDVIAFSITSGEHEWMNNIGYEIRKKFRKKIICGGPHPTFYPEIINEEYLDAICIGEGERAILNFVSALENKEDITTIKNMYVKKDGKLYKNDVDPDLQDLNLNPFPDKSIYDIYGFHRDLRNPVTGKNLFQAGRGCAFKCTFCFNKKYNKIYNGKSKVMRRKKVEKIIEEILIVKRKYPKMEFILFSDDYFTSPPRKWIFDFLDQYKEKINLPFMIQTRADSLDEILIARLKEANCFSIKLGVESGNDYIRNKILKKSVSKRKLLNAAFLMKKYGIHLHTLNMLGNPRESLEKAFDTFELNKRMNPTFAWCSLLNPFPGTDIYEYALKNNFLENNSSKPLYTYSMFKNSPLKLKDKNKIYNLQKIFGFAVFLRLPKKIVKFLITLPFSKYYDWIFGLTFMLGEARIHKVNLIFAIKTALLNYSKYIVLN